MGNLWNLVRRELVEWRLVLLGCLLVGWLPWAVAWLPAFHRHPAPEVRQGVAIFSTLLFHGGFLILLGSSILGRELENRRLGFYFSRPISTWTLWAGKLTAAVLLLLLALVLLLLPSADLVWSTWTEFDSSTTRPPRPALAETGDAYFALSWSSFPGRLAPWILLLSIPLSLLLGLMGIHLVSSMIRSRSLWLLVDLSALALVIALGVWTYHQLLQEQAVGPIIWLERGLFLLLLLVFFFAGWRHLDQGRGDLSSGHRGLSLTLWPCLLLIFGGAAVWAQWIVRDDLSDLRSLQFVEMAPSGSWVVVGGRTAGRAGKSTAFAVDTESDRTVRLGGLDATRWRLVLSEDGRRIVWGKCPNLQPLGCELWTVDLQDPDSEPQPTGITINHYPSQIALSQDGSRLGIYHHKQFQIYELPSVRLLRTTHCQHAVRAATFLDEDRVRLFISEPTPEADFRLVIREMDLEGRLHDRGQLPDLLTAFQIHLRSADRLLYWSLTAPHFALAAGSGTNLATWPQTPQAGRFLSDGRVILAFQPSESTTRLLALSPSGEELLAQEFPGVSRVLLGGEPSSGKIWLGLRRKGVHPAAPILDRLGAEPLEGWSTALWDLDTGVLQEMGYGFAPVAESRRSTRLGTDRIGAPSSFLFEAGESMIFSWRPDSDEIRRVLGPMASSLR